MPDVGILETSILGVGFILVLGMMATLIRVLMRSLTALTVEQAKANEIGRELTNSLVRHVGSDSAIIQRLDDINVGVDKLVDRVSQNDGRFDRGPSGD